MSTTSLEKTAHQAQHAEIGRPHAPHDRPEVLRDMSETELAALEKKIVRKMDCLIL